MLARITSFVHDKWRSHHAYSSFTSDNRARHGTRQWDIVVNNNNNDNRNIGVTARYEHDSVQRLLIVQGDSPVINHEYEIFSHHRGRNNYWYLLLLIFHRYLRMIRMYGSEIRWTFWSLGDDFSGALRIEISFSFTYWLIVLFIAFFK